MSDLRSRIAAVIQPFLFDRYDCPIPSEAEDVADAVIRELDLATACESGCMWRIPDHIEDMTDTQKELLKIAEPPSWGTPSFDNGSRYTNPAGTCG